MITIAATTITMITNAVIAPFSFWRLAPVRVSIGILSRVILVSTFKYDQCQSVQEENKSYPSPESCKIPYGRFKGKFGKGRKSKTKSKTPKCICDEQHW